MVDGNVLKAFALLGLDEREKAAAAINKARELSPYDFRIYIFDSLINQDVIYV